MEYHNLEVKEVLRLKGSSFVGLNEAVAAERLQAFGENKIEEEKRFHPFLIFLRQFNEPVVYILVFAVVLSVVLRELLDAYVILGILVFNAALGFAQEYKAERTVELLRKLTTLKAKVVRNGVVKEVPSTALVPGDVVLIEAGDKVPADMRIVEAKNLQTNEAALTGESLPCTKVVGVLPGETELAERRNMLYAGTVVVRGVGRAVVVETGMQTEIGKIARMLQGVKEAKTPLQVRLQQVGKFLGGVVVGICGVVFVVGLVRGLDVYMMMLTAMSLAVAAVPEGLPAVVTVCLALSVQRMVRSKALVKKLKSIETLGDITVICSDKTGTLTKNEMTVKKVWVNNMVVDVTGFGYSREGQFLVSGKQVDPKGFRLLLEIGLTCNNATETVGDPTEMALVFVGLKGGASRVERVDEVPFDSDKKFMATVHHGYKYYKGAPEVILDFCNTFWFEGKVRRLLPKDREKIVKVNAEMAGDALRVLAFAYEKGGQFVFVGLMGMIDPPKEGVREAIMLCRRAGVRAVMITGDHPLTARAIARQVGMEGKIVTGRELDQVSDEELRGIVGACDVYARTSSAHKVRILNALQANGEIVAMTGDGINDAPALKKADVGVAMSVKGTDVSRDAAEMVLMDDNFSTIVKAIEQGRVVYDNIKKFVLYLLSANLIEIGVVLSSLVLGLPLPLLPIQLLWVNLMTDSWPALALGVDRAEDGVMVRKPRDRSEQIMAGMRGATMVTGVVGTVLIVVAFAVLVGGGADLGRARTVALTSLILFELFRAYGCRSGRAFVRTIFANRWLNLACVVSLVLQVVILYTPLSVAFKVVPLGVVDWLVVAAIATVGFVTLEVYKLVGARRVSVRHVVVGG